MIIYIALPQQVWSNECLWIRPEGFDWIWSLPSPCTCSSSREDFPFFQPLPFWKSDYIYNNWSHFQSFMTTNKTKFDKSSVGCVNKMNCMFRQDYLNIKEYEGKTRIFGIKTMLCRTHKNASPPLPTRSNWLGGFVSVTKLFSSSLCSSALHSLLLFPPHHLACSINIGQYLVSSSVLLDHTSHIFSSNALLSASFQERTHLPGYLPEALECPRLSDKVLLVEKNLSKGRILLPNRMNF